VFEDNISKDLINQNQIILLSYSKNNQELIDFLQNHLHFY